MTTPTRHLSSVLSVLVVACLLAACAAQMQQQPPATSRNAQDRARQAESAGDYVEAAQAYQQAASQATQPRQRLHLQLRAALDYAQAGQPSQAQQLLSGIQPDRLKDLDRARYQLARAQIRAANLPPERALNELPPPVSGAPAEIAQRVWLSRADLYFAQNDLISGLRALVQRDVWLVDDDALRANDRRIYDKALKAIAYGQGPESRVAQNADATTRGWLALADIGQQRWDSRQARDQAIAQWQQTYPGHPANQTVLPEQFDYQGATEPVQRREPGRQPLGEAPTPPTDTVALALPVSGDFSSAAEAIRDGFMFAYAHDSSTPSRPTIYDTQSMSAGDIVQRARQDRVGILVGPLNKPKVTAMTRLKTEFPVLALNYTDQPVRQAGFYQFALAPEDEARAVARRAEDQGYGRALALVPQGDWGSRVFDAFRSAFSDSGGRVVDYATFDPEQHDHRQPIQSLLRSYRQGQGVDFIFVAAQPVQARLIRSQLRYYHASDLPMLATSHIYTGTVDTDNDIDLNGVGFADMPWVVGDGGFISHRRDEAEQRYGDIASRYTRLFAMGMDAWRLTDQIGSGGLHAGDAYEGMTGVLAVRPNGRIRRYMAWAAFRNGKPQLVRMPSVDDVQRAPAKPSAPWAQR